MFVPISSLPVLSCFLRQCDLSPRFCLCLLCLHSLASCIQNELRAFVSLSSPVLCCVLHHLSVSVFCACIALVLAFRMITSFLHAFVACLLAVLTCCLHSERSCPQFASVSVVLCMCLHCLVFRVSSVVFRHCWIESHPPICVGFCVAAHGLTNAGI